MNLEEYKEKLVEYASRLNKVPIDSPIAHLVYRGNDSEKFLDENYDMYINTTADERKEIRQIIKDHDRSEKYVYGGGPLPAPFRYELNFYGIRAIKQLEATGDVVWVWRGLVAIGAADEPPERTNEVCERGSAPSARWPAASGASQGHRADGYRRRSDGADLRSRSEAVGAISMLDGIHYRPDDKEHLARLYVAAEEREINPKPIFQLISKISSNEPTKPGETSISELIANIPNTAHEIVDEFRKVFLVDKENE